LEAITEVYGGREPDRPLVIGSVKSYLGHTFAAAGGAGLLRALAAIEAAATPPNTNFRCINPALRPADIPAVIGCERLAWPAPANGPRRAAVSSFGTGGINYHLLVEEYQQP
ncbi:MAG: polyketide synthase, partial [Jatrophihabitantaceae bacterium]